MLSFKDNLWPQKTERARLAAQNAMPGIAKRLAAPEQTSVVGYDRPVLPDYDAAQHFANGRKDEFLR